jgi:hypothetical protein
MEETVFVHVAQGLCQLPSQVSELLSRLVLYLRFRDFMSMLLLQKPLKQVTLRILKHQAQLALRLENLPQRNNILMLKFQ